MQHQRGHIAYCLHLFRCLPHSREGMACCCWGFVTWIIETEDLISSIDTFLFGIITDNANNWFLWRSDIFGRNIIELVPPLGLLFFACMWMSIGYWIWLQPNRPTEQWTEIENRTKSGIFLGCYDFLLCKKTVSLLHGQKAPWSDPGAQGHVGRHERLTTPRANIGKN